ARGRSLADLDPARGWPGPRPRARDHGAERGHPELDPRGQGASDLFGDANRPRKARDADLEPGPSFALQAASHHVRRSAQQLARAGRAPEHARGQDRRPRRASPLSLALSRYASPSSVGTRHVRTLAALAVAWGCSGRTRLARPPLACRPSVRYILNRMVQYTSA